MCYRPTAAGVLQGASQLDLIFIRIACHQCHIIRPPAMLWWTQFSTVVAPIPTSWSFTLQQSQAGQLVIRAFTITGPCVVDLLKEGFSASPTEETRSAAALEQATYRKTGTHTRLSQDKQCPAQTWEVQVVHVHTDRYTHALLTDMCRLRQYKLMLLLCRGFKRSMGDN